MRLYHLTTDEAARSILADGFRNSEGTYLTDELQRGVWLTDDPVGCPGSGAVWGVDGGTETILEVQLDVSDDRALADFEWINEGFEGPAVVGVNYREWLVPAEWIRAHETAIMIVRNDDALLETLERERRAIPPLPIS